MTVDDLLAELYTLGAKLWAEEGTLAIQIARGALSQELKAALAAHKPELLRRLREERHASPDAQIPMVVPAPLERYLPFPLTELQQAYWVGRSGAVEFNGAVHPSVAIHVYNEIEDTDLDLSRFIMAWRSLVVRHEMLRAVGLASGEQRILEQVPPYEIEIEDLRGWPAERAAMRLTEVRERLSHRVAPLDKWPLFELRGFSLDGNRQRMCVSIDCTFIDAWSLQILFRELVSLYQDPACTLSPERLDLSFRDYVIALSAVSGTKSYRKSIDYWRGRIPSIAPAPNLPVNSNLTALAHPKYRRWADRLDHDLAGKLKTQARRRGLTPPGLLLAAYAEVLALWSREPQFTINVPIYNRLPLHPQVNDVVGTFSSFTLVEIDGCGLTSFEARARKIQRQLWEVLEHREVSGVTILREMFQRQGKISGALMPVVFTSFPSTVEGRDTYWVDLLERELGQVIYSVTQTPQVWIDHQVLYQEEEIVFNWDVIEDLFPGGMVDAMFAAYCRLLRRLANEDKVWQAANLCLQEPVEGTHRVSSEDDASKDCVLQQLFTEQAALRPDQIALISTDRQFTYRELSRHANRLGRRLRRLGARPNHPVAIVMEKGWEQTVAVLGTLMSGAPYMPIDPALPKERLNYLLENGRIEVVLTQSSLEPQLSWLRDITLLCIDCEDFTDEDPAPADPVQHPGDLAFIIYTSGSTGLPAGAMLTHRGAVNAIVDTNRYFGIHSGDRTLALTALHHDMSVYDIFGMLAAGGTIVVPSAAGKRDPSHWWDVMLREGVTVWNSVPAFMEMLIAFTSAQPDPPASSLRLAFIGGDWIPVSLPGGVQSLAERVQVISVGGPTETTLWNIWYPIEEVDPAWKSIPYGRPISNTKYYVMNEVLEERPIWVPGELCCAGVGVATGYWQDEARTAAKFVRHPITGERLYRTGDLGRRLPDGNIEFLGRIDDQISVLGQRIEPGEIESTLLQNPAVKAAVVVAPGEHHEKRLQAYVVLMDGVRVTGDELKTFLKGKLASALVPSSFVFVDSLPLTPNGKVDRKALMQPLPVAEARAQDHSEGHLRGGIEEPILAIVREVLDTDTISAQTNFFDLGANSVHLVRLHVALQQALGVDVPIAAIFQHPTIEFLAKYLDEEMLSRNE